jgi:hypothetical protein
MIKKPAVLLGLVMAASPLAIPAVAGPSDSKQTQGDGKPTDDKEKHKEPKECDVSPKGTENECHAEGDKQNNQQQDNHQG